MSHFRTTYKKHTHFGNEHIRLNFTYVPTSLSDKDLTTIRCKIDRNADGLADMYVVFTVPDIWSPMFLDASTGEYNGVEFQWISRLGFNAIERVNFLINGQKVVEHTGEWMKLNADLTYGSEKKRILNEMIGHEVALYDPANAGGNGGQYPNAFNHPDGVPEPSIKSRQIIIPMQFFFCESEKQMLPLIKLDRAVCELEITFRTIYDLFTIVDLDKTSVTYGQRIRPNPGIASHRIVNFLSPPDSAGSPTDLGKVWVWDPYVEANYIFLDEDERRQLAAEATSTLLIKEITFLNYLGLWGNNTLEVSAFNMVSRFVWVAIRNDSIYMRNQWDNYTNWDDVSVKPRVPGGGESVNNIYSSGLFQGIDKNIIKNANFLIQGGQKLVEDKNEHFFRLVHHYRHSPNPPQIEGIGKFSFALNNDSLQPSGMLNASVAGKIHMRVEMQTPPVDPSGQAMIANVCPPDENGNIFPIVPTLGLSGRVAQYNKSPYDVYQYVYDLRLYVESYNFLMFADGTAALKFAK